MVGGEDPGIGQLLLDLLGAVRVELVVVLDGVLQGPVVDVAVAPSLCRPLQRRAVLSEARRHLLGSRSDVKATAYSALDKMGEADVGVGRDEGGVEVVGGREAVVAQEEGEQFEKVVDPLVFFLGACSCRE